MAAGKHDRMFDYEFICKNRTDEHTIGAVPILCRRLTKKDAWVCTSVCGFDMHMASHFLIGGNGFEMICVPLKVLSLPEAKFTGDIADALRNEYCLATTMCNSTMFGVDLEANKKKYCDFYGEDTITAVLKRLEELAQPDYPLQFFDYDFVVANSVPKDQGNELGCGVVICRRYRIGDEDIWGCTFFQHSAIESIVARLPYKRVEVYVLSKKAYEKPVLSKTPIETFLKHERTIVKGMSCIGLVPQHEKVRYMDRLRSIYGQELFDKVKGKKR